MKCCWHIVTRTPDARRGLIGPDRLARGLGDISSRMPSFAGSEAACHFRYGLSETFNTLTSGKIKPRFQPSDAAKLISINVGDDTRVLGLPLQARLAAFDEAESRGVRGGAIYDYLRLVAARHHGMERLNTLNMSHFQSFWQPGDPEIAHP